MHEITKNSEKLFLQFIAEGYEGSFTYILDIIITIVFTCHCGKTFKNKAVT